jgi:mRNA interferase MazF
VVIGQGEVHWIDFGAPRGSAPAKRRPCVIVQNDAFNASRISTVVVAAITGNLLLGQAFGNVRLRKGEAGLKRRSVVNISQLITVDRAMLRGRIGKLSRRRLGEVLQGIYGLLRPVEPAR